MAEKQSLFYERLTLTILMEVLQSYRDIQLLTQIRLESLEALLKLHSNERLHQPLYSGSLAAARVFNTLNNDEALARFLDGLEKDIFNAQTILSELEAD